MMPQNALDLDVRSINTCIGPDVASWHQADVPSPHNHVRLARQTGNHLNLLSISADDPKRL
jgi:hypothetical protein